MKIFFNFLKIKSQVTMMSEVGTAKNFSKNLFREKFRFLSEIKVAIIIEVLTVIDIIDTLKFLGKAE